MDNNRKKQLLSEYKDRKPEMGIIAFGCISTKDVFLGIAKDTKAAINRNRFELNMNGHKNPALQNLWVGHGCDGFEVFVLEVLPYDETDPGKDDYTKELETLYQQKMSIISHARELKK